MAHEITPDDLLERLRNVYEVASVEDLRGKVPNSVRTLQRWKKEGWPQSAKIALDLLSQAGLLRLAEENEAGGGGTSELVLAGLVASVATLIEDHRQALADLEAVHKRLDRVQEDLAARPAARVRK